MSAVATKLRLFLLFAAIAFVTRAVALGLEIVDVDEASYAVAAAELLRGKWLYQEVTDHHPPLVYAYYALARALLGPGLLAVRLATDLVIVPSTALALSAFFAYDRRGLLAGLAYLASAASFIGHDMLAVNAEILMLLPAAWALVPVRDEGSALSRGRALLAGALLGLATLAKYQAALWLPALLLTLGRAGQRRRKAAATLGPLLALCLGFGAPLLAVWGGFAAHGLGDAFIYWNLAHNLAYTANPLALREAVERAATYLLPFLVVNAPLLAGWALARPIDVPVHPRMVTTTTLVASLVAAALGWRFYPHYFLQLAPPLALGAAPWLARLDWAPPRGAARRIAAWAFVAFALSSASTYWLYYVRRDVYDETRPAYRRVAEALRSDPCQAGASLFVWGWGPLVNHLADLPLGSRFLFVESTLVGYVPGNRGLMGDPAARARIDPQHWEWLMQDLRRTRSTYIVDTAPAGLHRWQNYPIRDFPQLAELLHAEYERIGSVERVDLYRRKGCLAEIEAASALR